MNIHDFMAEKGFNCFQPDFTGFFQRSDRNGVLNAWYCGEKIILKNNKEIYTAKFGDWKTDEKYLWSSEDISNYSPEEAEAVSKELKQIAQAKAAEKEKRHQKASHECFELFSHSKISSENHAYLQQKGLDRGSWRQRVSASGDLLIPLCDAQGKLWNLQKISASGVKTFYPGGKITGLFHILVGEIHAKEIYLCEGFATGASIATALDGYYKDRGTSYAVMCAFNAGNLVAAARAIRSTHPDAKITVCADNDAFTSRPDGSPWNPGLEKARQVYTALAQPIRLVWPVFVTPEPGFTDFNDLHAKEGLEVVRGQLLDTQLPKDTGAGDLPDDLPKKKEVFSEKKIADIMLGAYSGDLIRQDKSIFKYDGKRWLELDSSGLDELKNEINSLCGDKLPSKTVNSIFATFCRYLEAVPEGVNLFQPNKTCGNFLDGTLRLRRDSTTGKYTLDFGPHDRRDFVTWVIPVNYNCDRQIKNSKFEALLEAAFTNDIDKAAKIRAIKQCGGAMLMPAFSQMVFFHGVSGSRKSTIAKCFAKLLHLPNISFVDPTIMEGFQVEGMIGKLVNMNTDIDDHVALPRGFLKRFDDALPFQVNRKGKTVVQTTLPMVHLYCANKLPPNFEGNGKALYRRLTLVEFLNDLTNGDRDGEIKYYEDVVYSEGYEGLLNFMLEGLEDLVAHGGKFAVPESSRKKLEDWQGAMDMTTQFIDAARAGELCAGDKNSQMKVDDAMRIKPNDLWECFKKFHLDVAPSRRIMGRNAFYSAMRDRQFKLVNINGWPHYQGIGVTGVKECQF